MENIFEPNGTFDFSRLSLAHPVGIQGGAYFTKIEYNKKPLYIQTNKSQSRQGFVKTGKKYYIDLMFDKNAEELINWFENLETSCQKLIFEKRETWFQNGLEESDIESAFNSAIRVYKSGKFYLLRTNIKNNHQNEPIISIYNEQKNPLKIENITTETNFISILEIQGIKFTTRNFQIEIELKQMMVLDDNPIFDNFLIKTDNKTIKQNTTPNIPINISTSNYEENNDLLKTENIEKTNDLLKTENIEKTNDLEKIDELLEFDFSIPEQSEEKKEDSILLDYEDLEENIEAKNEILNEVKNLDLSLEKNLEPLHLKKPNQVYFELYKEARNKAKLAKKNAIIAYLEAKNIKKTYMIENLAESDSDFDAEIDEVSESELEYL
jgi:hypothetical protein